MKPHFLAVETTGIDEKDRIIQVAFKKVGEKVWYESLFKPPIPVSIDAMSICHITNEELETKIPFIGSSLFEILKVSFVDPETVFVAHNASFDLKFLAKEGLKLPEKHVCTMKIAHAKDATGLLEKHNLQFLRYYHGLKFDQKINPHDAMSDIIVLEGLFNYYLKTYTIEEMVEISSKPILLKKIMFGKFKGMWFKDIAKKEMSYLRWMRTNVEMDENMKYTVNYYIENI